ESDHTACAAKNPASSEAVIICFPRAGLGSINSASRTAAHNNRRASTTQAPDRHVVPEVLRPGGAADGSQGWSERSERNPWTRHVKSLEPRRGDGRGERERVRSVAPPGLRPFFCTRHQGFRCAPPLATIG